MRTSIIRAYALGIITGAFTAAATILAVPHAKADGYLDTDEQIYVEAYGGAVCATLDEYPSMGGVMGIAQAIEEQGYAADSAVDIINAAVSTQCDEYWPLLKAIGRAARAQNGASA